MKNASQLLCACTIALGLIGSSAHAQTAARPEKSAPTTAATAADETAIRDVINMQEKAWNSGDLQAFLSGYADSPETSFLGKGVIHGIAGIRAYYAKNYGTPAQRGTLRFSEVDIHKLCSDYAMVTGRFTLTPSGAQPTNGVFSLLWRKTGAGWKIVLDHSS